MPPPKVKDKDLTFKHFHQRHLGPRHHVWITNIMTLIKKKQGNTNLTNCKPGLICKVTRALLAESEQISLANFQTLIELIEAGERYGGYYSSRLVPMIWGMSLREAFRTITQR